MLPIPQARLVRNLRRSREITRILAFYGFGWLLSGWDQSALGQWRHRWGRYQKREIYTGPQQVRLALEELGTTFIKLGQALSTRPDLVPPEYLIELAQLQDNVRPVPYPLIADIIERELGAPPHQIFAVFDATPRATASIGQVHRAQLADGTRVIVKVQRPGVQEQVAEDLAILADVAAWLAKREELSDAYDFEGWVDEFAVSLQDEMDFTLEGRNADRMRRNFADDPTLHIPTVYWNYTTPTVLVQEEIQGIKISDFESLDAFGLDREVLAETCARIALVQIFKHGFFHADPHSGNFFVEPDGTVALIDFGLVGRLDRRMREALVRLMLAIANRDAERLVDELLALGVTRRDLNRNVLKRDLDHLIYRYADGALGDVSGAQILAQVTAVARKNRLQLPAELTLLFKVIIMDEGLGTALDPNFRLVEFAQPYFREFWRENMSPRALARRVKETTREIGEIGQDLPRHFKRLLLRLENGEIALEGQLEETRTVVSNLNRAANRIAMSILVAGGLIGLGSVLRSSRSRRTDRPEQSKKDS